MLPNEIVVLGKTYTIILCDKPSEVDIFKRDSLWGQVDYWTRTIRIYKNMSVEDLFQNLLHEILHTITSELYLQCFKGEVGSRQHDELDIVALALTDVLFRNQWIKDELCKPD